VFEGLGLQIPPSFNVGQNMTGLKNFVRNSSAPDACGEAIGLGNEDQLFSESNHGSNKYGLLSVSSRDFYTLGHTRLLGLKSEPMEADDIASRIRLALDRKNLSIRAASLAAGLGADTLGKVLIGKTKFPRGDNLMAISKVLGVSESWLTTGKESQRHHSMEWLGLPYAGIAEAGAFRPVDMLDQVSEERIIDLPRDPRFPKAKQYAFEIRGDSMTEANLYEGMWAVAIDYHDYTEFYGDLRDGVNVVVSRSRNGDPERELSVKELKVFRDRTELHPRSKNPKHTVQVFPAEHNPENPVEIEILAVVANAVWLMKI
jgi:transcriptional regulator with XRE-family HTH domain